MTEKKEADEMLKESEENFRTLVENLPQKIFLKDRKSVYISCNQNYAKDLKIKPEQIKGRTDYEFYPKKLAEKYREDDRKIMKHGKIREIDEEYVQNGKKFFVHTIKVPVRDERGKVMGVLGIFWDMTEKKEADEMLKEKFELEKALTKILFRLANPKNMNKTIDSALAEIGVLRDASRTYLFILGKDGKTMSNVNEWCAKGVKPQIKNLQNLPTSACPWWMKKLKKNGVIHIIDVNKMPKEARNEKKILKAQNIKSLLVLPVNSKKGLIGFIGFDDTQEAKPWQKEDIVLLRSIAKILEKSLDAEKILQENKERCGKSRIAMKLKIHAKNPK